VAKQDRPHGHKFLRSRGTRVNVETHVIQSVCHLVVERLRSINKLKFLLCLQLSMEGEELPRLFGLIF